jgi:hypothetical protein
MLRLLPGGRPPSRFAARIRVLERELAALHQQQRDELLAILTLVVGSGHCFSAKELWQHRRVSPLLAVAFRDLRISNAQQLGKKLKQLGLTRVGEDNAGVVWVL